METIYQSESIKIIECLDKDGDVQRQIFLGPSFQNVQGAIKKGRPNFHVHDFTKNLFYGALCVPSTIDNALFLGLGAGITIQAVRGMFPRANIDIVDTNHELFEISDRFFFRIADSDGVSLYCEDAFEFVKKSNRRYDYVCCDIWGHGLEVPGFLIEDEFVWRVKDISTAHGVFSINTQRFLHKQLSEMLVREFRYVLSLKGFNCLLIAANGRPKLTSDPAILRDMLANDVDIKAIQENLMLIRTAQNDDFV